MNPMPNPVIDEPIDRDIPDLKTTKKKTNITRLVVVSGLLFAVILAAFGITLFMKQLEKNKRQEVAEKAKERPKIASTATKEDFEAAQARIRREKAKAEEEQAREAARAAAANPQGLIVPAGAIGVTATAPQGGQGATGMGTAQTTGHAGSSQVGANMSGGGTGGGRPRIQTAAQRRMDGDVLVQTSNGSLGGEGSGERLGVAGAPLAVRQTSESPQGGLDEKVKASVLRPAVATQRPDLTMLLQRGTAIPCGLITKIISEQAGMVTCEISNDVWSADGKVVLIERGSKAFGERREVMMQGQARIGVIWSTIDTPYGVHLDIASLATDPLGAAGIPADVDNHVGKRFGGAVLLSLIGDVGQALANRARDGGGTITFGNTATAGQDLASKTLEHTIDIPPTGYVNQGNAITILALRDIDFRGVYELARK